ncbi:hypothetical protein LINPERHAP2_LOCUS38082 [Linum perenne]
MKINLLYSSISNLNRLKGSRRNFYSRSPACYSSERKPLVSLLQLAGQTLSRTEHAKNLVYTTWVGSVKTVLHLSRSDNVHGLFKNLLMIYSNKDKVHIVHMNLHGREEQSHVKYWQKIPKLHPRKILISSTK